MGTGMSLGAWASRPQFSNAAGGSRLLVASQYEKDAKQIIALVKAGAFALKEGDDVG